MSKFGPLSRSIRLHLGFLLALVAVAAMLAPTASSASAAANAIPQPSLALYDAILPDIRDDIYAATADDLPIYDIVATFYEADDGPGRIAGHTDLLYVNFTDAPQDELYLRLYPNAPVYEEGGIALDEVRVAGEVASPRYDHDDTLVALDLPGELAPGGQIEVDIAFTSTIPQEPDESYGMFAFERDGSSYNLAHWQPLLAGWTPGEGWNIEPVDLRGDPVFTNAALFSVELTAPSALVFATTGIEVDTVTEGRNTVHAWESGPSRDFVMIANPDFLVLEGVVDETLVRAFYTPETAEMSEAVLEMTMASLEIFNELFGTYPYRELDLAEAYIGPRAAGIEFPGLVYISRNLYDPENPYLEFTVVHEVAHQWWYALVGNNQYLHAFLDESLSNYSSVLYIELRYGEEAAQRTMDRYLKRTYFATLFGREGDHVVNQATGSFSTTRAYGRTVYGKGALGMHAIREVMGLEAFSQALTTYVAEHRFGVARPEDLFEAFQQASNTDLTELWRHWFDAAEGEQDYNPSDLIEIS